MIVVMDSRQSTTSPESCLSSVSPIAPKPSRQSTQRNAGPEAAPRHLLDTDQEKIISDHLGVVVAEGRGSSALLLLKSKTVH